MLRFSKWKAKEDGTNTFREVTGETSLVKAAEKLNDSPEDGV